MSTKMPVVEGEKIVRALRRIGFRVDRIVGSHHVLAHDDGRFTSVPCHSRKTVKRGTLAQILRDVRLTPDELRELL